MKIQSIKKSLFLVCVVSFAIYLSSTTAFAETITEAEVQAQVDSHGTEAVSGNVFIWFLCAIAFLKVSQKIDSFMSSLGINVGNTGGNMLSELLIAGRGITNSISGNSRKSSGGNSSPGDNAVGGRFLSGGLAGSVSRQMERSAVNTLTGHSESGGFGNALYQSSVQKGGDFANQVISDVAKGNYGSVGSIKGHDAAQAFNSYMGLSESNQTVSGYSDDSQSENTSFSAHQTVNGTADSSSQPLPTYSNMEIGGGRITGTETEDGKGRDFSMYSADQYMAPTKGEYETATSVDGTLWYKQYAQDEVERKPYQAENGKVAYHESIVQKLPPTPPRKDRV
jgi:hypothetical protein